MQMSGRVFASVALVLPVLLRAAQTASRRGHADARLAPLNWQAFLDLLSEAADSQQHKPWNQSAYVARVSSLARAIDFDGPFLRGRTKPAGYEHPSFEEVENRQTFQITLISFETGDRIPPHDHPGITGVSACATGTVHVDSYTRLSSPDASGEFMVGRVERNRLAPGKTSAFTSTHANIHELHALSSAQIIDIFTPPYDGESLRKSRWYTLEPARPRDNLFRATTCC